MGLLNQFVLSGHQSVSLHAKEGTPVCVEYRPFLSTSELFLMFSYIPASLAQS